MPEGGGEGAGWRSANTAALGFVPSEKCELLCIELMIVLNKTFGMFYQTVAGNPLKRNVVNTFRECA